MTWKELLERDAERKSTSYARHSVTCTCKGWHIDVRRRHGHYAGAQIPNERLLLLIEVIKGSWEVQPTFDKIYDFQMKALADLRKELEGSV